MNRFSIVSSRSVNVATNSFISLKSVSVSRTSSKNKASSNVYLEDVIGCDEEGNNILLSDVMSQEDEDITHKVDLESYSKKMEALFDTILSPREKTIIKMRYGIGQPRRYSQLEIAELLSISRSYVSRIEKKVIEKLAFEFGKKQHEVF